MNTQTQFNPSLVQQPHAGCLTTRLRAQFACPRGRLGRLAGHMMAVANAPLNRFAIEQLDVQPENQVLEIGCGGGRTIQQLARLATHGMVTGIDLSDVMVRQAVKYNAGLIAAGRVDLCRGSVANLPYEYARFDRVLAVSNYQFWPNQEHNLDEVRRVLRPAGRLLLALRTRQSRLAPGVSEEQIEEMAGLVRWVGFEEVLVQTRGAAVCISARR